MSYSDNASRPIWLVFSNSTADYRILASSAIVDSTMQSLVRRIAGACEKAGVDKSLPLAGVVPSTMDSMVIVFRAFDVGSFRHRPHTLGLVVIHAPLRSQRGWRLGDLLERLSPPVPDRSNYAFPAPDEIFSSAQAPTFVAVNAWDESSGDQVPATLHVFSEHPEAAERFESAWRGAPDTKKPGGLSRAGLWALPLICILGVAALSIMHIMQRRPIDRRTVQTRQITEDEAEYLADLLKSAGVRGIHGASNPDRLGEMAVKVEDELKRRIVDLRNRLDRQGPAADRAAVKGIATEFLRVHRQGLDQGSSTERAEPPAESAWKAAIDTLRQYDAVVYEAQGLTTHQTDSREFVNYLEGLKRKLSGVR